MTQQVQRSNELLPSYYTTIPEGSEAEAENYWCIHLKSLNEDPTSTMKREEMAKAKSTIALNLG